ncbi:MAG: serine/threonine protein kinase, partial [Candidatus Saccharimonas sp.]|nr:serine/threonine protein kinase [Planctomycetaceae bacterium]
MSTPADCNLLLGVLALQLDFVTREQLVAVVTGWLREKETPLGQLFERQKILTAARRQLLEALVDEHLRQHGGDVEQSLATLSSLGPVRDELQRLGDEELSISLSRVAGGAAAARSDVALSDLPAASSVSNPGPRPETASEDSVPPRLRFRILRPHAEGGLGRVLVAHDEELHREVALKEIKPQFAMDVDSRNRFTLEAEVTGGLEHPGIVPVYGLGQYSDGRPYYAMRFIRGDSLKEAIEQFHAMPRAQIVSLATAPTIVTVPTLIATEPASRLVSSEIFAGVEFRKLLGRFIDVCQAIEYAHSRGVLHRDLKPGNIMLGKYGETLVVDWGLAKVAGKDDRFANVDEATLVPSSGSSIENTADGSVIGTPAYMSPEQAAGRLDQLGPATDVYSLGATLYHVLTGRSPFSKLPLPELLARVQRGDFPRPRELNSSIPKSLESVCLKAMALLPEHRYESAAAIAEDIEHWLADEPVNAHRESTPAQASRWVRKHRAWAISGAAALALVAVVSSIAAVWINAAREKANLNAEDALR